MRIVNLNTETFYRIMDELRAAGWNTVEEYDNADEGIDGGIVVLMKDGLNLRFEWDSWSAGTIVGPDAIIRDLRGKYCMK